MTTPPGPPLRACAQPLSQTYDVALVDLDGVVYVGTDPVPGAADALSRARERGMAIGFVTNNASRSPETVLAHLADLGVAADVGEVITSAQTAAAVLARRLPAGATVLVVGTDALAAAVRARGLVAVTGAEGPGTARGRPGAAPWRPGTAPQRDSPAAVVQGYSADTGWRDLAAAIVALRQGAWWVATNADATVPSPDGPLPGNGAFVEVIRRTTGLVPVVTGKPEPAMHRECLERMHAVRPLVVGDRLDTDIEGASRVGCDSLLVLTGITAAPALLNAGPSQRPTYIAEGLDGLNSAHPAAIEDVGGWHCDGWSVRVHGRQLHLAGTGAAMDALRALSAAAWASRDRLEHSPEFEQVEDARVDLDPPARPRAAEAERAVNEAYQLVAVGAEADVCLGGLGLDHVLQDAIAKPPEEDHVQVAEPAGHGAVEGGGAARIPGGEHRG